MIVRLFAFIFIALFGVSCSTNYSMMDGGFSAPTNLSESKNSFQRSQGECTITTDVQIEISDTLSAQAASNSSIEVHEIANLFPKIQTPNKQYEEHQKKVKIKKVNGIDRTIRKIEKTVAKIGLFSSVIGLLSSRLILFSVIGILLGLISLIYKAKFWTKIYAFLAISLGLLGLISSVLTSVLLILVVILLILLTLKWMHWG